MWNGKVEENGRTKEMPVLRWGKLKYTNRLIMLANTEWNVQNARCVHQITTNQKKQSKYGIGE